MPCARIPSLYNSSQLSYCLILKSFPQKKRKKKEKKKEKENKIYGKKELYQFDSMKDTAVAS